MGREIVYPMVLPREFMKLVSDGNFKHDLIILFEYNSKLIDFNMVYILVGYYWVILLVTRM
mgnify:FL=1